MARTTWTFDSVTFRVKAAESYDPWFSRTIDYTLDKVLGGYHTYLDQGAVTFTPLSFTAQFASEATRDAMLVKIGTTGTLSNDSPAARSGSATLVRALRVDGPSGQAFYLDCTFEGRPA
jgi:hypothetical protein